MNNWHKMTPLEKKVFIGLLIGLAASIGLYLFWPAGFSKFLIVCFAALALLMFFSDFTSWLVRKILFWIVWAFTGGGRV